MTCLSVTDKLHEAATPIWARCLAHPFVTGIGDGSLPVEKFRYFMLQDYLYLFTVMELMLVSPAISSCVKEIGE